MNSNGFLFDLDPVLLDLSFVQVRYYGVVFALTLFVAYLLWCWQINRAGASKQQTEAILLYGGIGTIVGARLGHCLFYDWNIYSQNLLSILYIWRGGLASHGATVGILLALYLFARRYKLPYLIATDRFTFSAAIGAAGIRLGNFLNSEIVGRATDQTWGVRFLRYDDHGALLRHPSQLYEFGMGIFMLLVLLAADRLAGREKRPAGLLTGIFLTLYFTMRFIVEFVKEYQSDFMEDRLHGGLTMGQKLSVLPVLLGVGLIVYAITKARRARAAEQTQSQEQAPADGAAGGE